MKTKIFNLIILDKSGSMSNIASAAIAGVNETIGSIMASAKKHSEDQEHFFSLVAFCECERKYIFENVPIADVKPISAADYQPCCGTPLYDAVGITLHQLEKDVAKDENAVAQVTIITDGYENASKEYSGNAVKRLIEDLKKKGWTFAFIGANQDADAVAFSISINNSMNFTADQSHTRAMFSAFAGATARWADRVSSCMERAPKGKCAAAVLSAEEEACEFFSDDDKERANN